VQDIAIAKYHLHKDAGCFFIYDTFNVVVDIFGCRAPRMAQRSLCDFYIAGLAVQIVAAVCRSK
jgi:hypothetical protein